MKKLGLAAIVASGLAAGAIGLGSSVQASDLATSLPVISVTDYTSGVDHQQHPLDAIQP